MKKVISSIVIVMVLLSLVACGGGAGTTYKISGVEAAGQTFTVEEFSELAGMDLSSFEITIQENGKWTGSVLDPETGKLERGGGTYVLENDVYTLSENGEEAMTMEVRDGGQVLAADLEGMGYILFEKVAA